MSIEVGLRYPHRLGGIIGISGYVCEPDKLLKELSPVAMQQRALALATPDVLAEMQEHLRLYQAGKPVRKALPSARPAPTEDKKATPWWKKKRR